MIRSDSDRLPAAARLKHISSLEGNFWLMTSLVQIIFAVCLRWNLQLYFLGTRVPDIYLLAASREELPVWTICLSIGKSFYNTNGDWSVFCELFLGPSRIFKQRRLGRTRRGQYLIVVTKIRTLRLIHSGNFRVCWELSFIFSLRSLHCLSWNISVTQRDVFYLGSLSCACVMILYFVT